MKEANSIIVNDTPPRPWNYLTCMIASPVYSGNKSSIVSNAAKAILKLAMGTQTPRARGVFMGKREKEILSSLNNHTSLIKYLFNTHFYSH